MTEKIEWESIPIGEIAPASSNGLPDDDLKVWNLSLEDVESITGRILKKKICRVRQLGSAKCSFDERHVLYSKLRPYLNKVVLPDEAGVGTSELIPMLPDSRRLDREFLAYYLRSPIFLDFAKANTRGANLPRIAMKELWKHKIPMPNSLTEQHRVVARIKECMERVEEIEALRTECYNECTTVLPAYYHNLRRGLDQRYTTIPLADAGIVSGGGTPSRKRNDFWNGDIPWISPKEMKHRDLFNATQNITEAAIQGSSTKLIKEPSVLFVVRGMILSHTLPVAVNRVPVTINQDMKAITPWDNIKVDFLAAILRGAERELLSKVEVAGHGTRRLQTAHWSALPVPIVSEQDQAAIVSEVQNMEEIADALKRDVELDEIHLLRESILRKAFAGEL